MVKVDWSNYKAAIWRRHSNILRPVIETDSVSLDELIGIDTQKKFLFDNTAHFINEMPANHALLWGSKGTGKSSLIKAVFNHFSADGLRLVEIDKDDLSFFPEIIDTIRDEPYKFIIYCDDFSFEQHDNQYKHLKSVLEGSIEKPPQNVLIYATSNRRRLMPEYMRDNLASESEEGEVHFSDTVEEKTALADRFGLWLSFHPPSMSDYLNMVDYYMPEESNREKIHKAAMQFAILRGSKSGRTAKQFSIHYAIAESG